MSSPQWEWALEVLTPDGQVDRSIELRDAEVEIGRDAGGVRFPSQCTPDNRWIRIAHTNN